MNLNDVIDKINYAIDKIMDFYSEICLETGLKQWQLFAIGLVVLVLLMLFLRHLRKKRIKKIHTIKSKDRVEIIGTRLSRQQSKQRAPEVFTKSKADFAPEQDEQHSWGQTTKDWRQLREKIRHLEREITKYQRTEKHLNEQITELKSNKTDLKNIKEQLNQLKNTNTELKNNNELLQLQINEHVKIEQNLKEQINQSKTACIEQIQKEETIQNHNTISSEPELKVNQKSLDVEHEEQSIESHKEIKQATVEQQTENDEQQEKPESTQIIEEIQDNPIQRTLKEDTAKQQPDKSEIDRSVDIKELQAIADLAKRLQDRSQQQQNK